MAPCSTKTCYGLRRVDDPLVAGGDDHDEAGLVEGLSVARDGKLSTIGFCSRTPAPPKK
jgi:hypothetical protein